MTAQPSRSDAIARILSGTPPRIGPFRLVTELGEGGFAPVFLAVEEYGGVELRTVALKLFALDEAAAAGLAGGSRGTNATSAVAQARARIIDEARALCRVEHPNVVRFFQMMEAPGGVLGLAMEHVRGTSLGERLERQGTLPLAVTLEIGAAVASALAAVHQIGLVHRDVKPDNVIEASGAFKLIDFGIATAARRPALAARRHAEAPSAARIAAIGAGSAGPGALAGVDLDAADRTVRATGRGEDGTGTDAVAGTMGYIDPVCLARGEPADASSDLYALGAMLYECLTGRMPSSEEGGPSASRIRMNVALGLSRPPSVAQLVPSIPQGVASLIDALVEPLRERRPQRAEWVACELERLRRVTRGVADRPLPPEGPFRGLAAFDERHRDVYFGRATDVASALEVLRSRGLLALVGPSGSGKSSLARAGILPSIVDGSLGAWPAQWRAVTFSPGPRPRAALAAALAPVLEGEHLPAEPAALALRLAVLVEQNDTGLVLLVDALEEVVTVAAPDERVYLASLLAALASRPVPGLRVVVTARRDLLDPLLAEPGLGVALARSVQLVAPLSAAAWLEVLQDRLAAYGYALEDAAMQSELARDLADTASAMPLVEFALAHLWAHRDDRRRVLPRSALARIGGLAGALAQHAEATLSAVIAAHGPHAATVAGDVLLALTTPHGTRATRTRSDLAQEVPDALRDHVLAAFEKERLVVVEGEQVTLAHDALIARWPRLEAWVQSLRRERETAREVEEAAARWKRKPERELLLRGSPLGDAQSLRRGTRVKLTPDASAFVEASRRDQRRAWGGLAALVASVLLGAAVLGAFYIHDTRAAERRADAEKEAALRLVAVMSATRNKPQEQRAREVEDLVKKKHACEKQLARCSGDAGAAGATPLP